MSPHRPHYTPAKPKTHRVCAYTLRAKMRLSGSSVHSLIPHQKRIRTASVPPRSPTCTVRLLCELLKVFTLMMSGQERSRIHIVVVVVEAEHLRGLPRDNDHNRFTSVTSVATINLIVPFTQPKRTDIIHLLCWANTLLGVFPGLFEWCARSAFSKFANRLEREF